MRISFNNSELSKPYDTERSENDKRFSLDKALEGRNDVAEIMDTALQSPMISDRYDGIMFSDVQVRRNKVIVYGADIPFKSMPQGETFPYKGTIAEDVVRYELDHLVVDDTQDSIKPIDCPFLSPAVFAPISPSPSPHRLLHRTRPLFRKARRCL